MTLIADMKLDQSQQVGLRGEISSPIRRCLWLLSAVIVFGAWEIAGRCPISPAFPPFSDTMAALFGMIADGSLGKALLHHAQAPCPSGSPPRSSSASGSAC